MKKIKLDEKGSVISESDTSTAPARIIEISDEMDAEMRALAERSGKVSAIRADINRVADQQAREGIISDVLAVLVVGMSQLTVAIAKAKTLEDVKAAAAPMAELGALIDAGIKDGSIKLPYMIKAGGAKSVMQDMVRLSNGVTEVLQSAQKA